MNSIDVMFLEDGSLDVIIKQVQLSMLFHIATPLKYGVSIWRDIRDSKTGSNHYEGSKMLDRMGYNITVLFNENNGNYQYIRSKEGMLEFGMEEDRGNKSLYCKMSVEIPIDICYDVLNKIIDKYTHTHN